ncbi:hypothetical protein [Porcincola intestinalis]|uniref:Uncharacterized protein n=1 Tax=Porcincola intestinalis TaxID=2606632 RepID=A0A6L5X5C4_9FIRM|nr:hypothetical protein [Porcincola intestinalis]MSS15579.1 hypothetical protein [Porcincola intestinalis]
MARDYQRHDRDYRLPQAAYMATLWVIRDYQRMKEEYASIGTISSPNCDGMPHAAGGRDANADDAIRAAAIAEKISAIEKSLQAVPADLRRGVWESIQYRSPYPQDADRTTYGRAKARFVRDVAKRLKIV